MTLQTLKDEYIILKSEFEIVKANHLQATLLMKDVKIIYKYLKQGIVEVEPIFISDEEGKPVITNQNDIDIVNNRIKTFEDYLLFMKITNIEFIEGLIKSNDSYSKPFRRYDELSSKRIGELVQDITIKQNEILSKGEEIKTKLLLTDGFEL